MSLSGLPIIPDAPRYFRTVSISNQGTSEVVLLDVRALPEMEDKLRLHDDLRVVENSSQGGMGNGTAEGPVGVSLAPGAEYQVAVVSVKAPSCPSNPSFPFGDFPMFGVSAREVHGRLVK